MIRTTRETDIPQIEQLMRSEPGFWHENWPEDALYKAICAADGLSFVWEENETITGFICAHDLGFRGYLSELIVGRQTRGKNIGTQLLQRVEQELQSRGCVVVIADVWKTAEPFYRKLGWRAPDVVLLAKRIERAHS